MALNYLSLRHYLKLPLVERVATPKTLPSVSIIVPAVAGEESQLEALLKNLQLLDYEDRDVIVAGTCDASGAVSSGATYADAAPDTRNTVVSVAGDAGAPPGGWTNRSWACWTAARESVADWLLFTDARTSHGPESLKRVVGFAVERGAAAVSVFFQQQVESFWERTLLPLGWQWFFSGISPIAINKARTPHALASGHYLLIQRETYFRAGGHEAVKDAPLDQLALAACLKRRGEIVIAARAERDGQLRMFDSPFALRRGLASAVRPGLQAEGSAVIWTVVAGALSLLALGCLAYGLVAGSHIFLLAALVAYLTSVAELFLWQFLFGAPITDALWQPVSAVVLLLIGAGGLLRTKA